MIAKITKRITALVLCLLMVASVLASAPMVMAATDEPAAPADVEGLETKKTVTDNGDGTYTISLETWTTGEISSVTSTSPCDIVFVIDQSGSMAWNMSGGTSTSASNPSRLTILKGIMTDFMTGAVNSTKDSSGNVIAQHRVAVVGFTHYKDYNTELLTGVTIDEDGDGVRHDKITTAQYQSALVDISTAAGAAGVTAAINALDDEGGTEPVNGLEMAANILKNAPSLGDDATRKKVVIFLTDGAPDDIDDSLGFDDTEEAVENAYAIKNTYGADLYAIGIFKGADPDEICLPVDSRWQADHETEDRANRFMNLVSSNYKAANSMYIRESGLFSQYCSAIPVARSTEDYYFASETQEGLQGIFDTISHLITTPTIELSAETTTVKDVVTPYFDLPANTSDIKVYTAEFNGTDFEERVESDLTASVSGSTVSVTGFDFDANCVTEEKKADDTYGKKLIVEFTITPKEGFLGGGNVPTNASGSGVVVNEDGSDVLIEEYIPEYPNGGNGVSVPLPETNDFTVTAKDKYVYLHDGLTTDDMLDNASFAYGTQSIDISAANNYGLAEWQNAYADIEIKTSDAIADVTEDGTFNISVTVTDKTNANNTVTNSVEKKVCVLKPTAAFVDDETIYGDQVEISDNATVEWKSGDKTDTALKAEDADVIGTAPEIAFTYEPVDEGTVNAEDTAVYFVPNGGGDFGIEVASAKIGETDIMDDITFEHTDCAEGEELPTGAHFLVHTEACVLAVTKKVVNSAGSENEAFIVKISDAAGRYNKTVVLKDGESVIIDGLPIGDYTVTEDTNWAWRYEASYEGFTNEASRVVSLSADNIDGSVTITNSRIMNKWLDFCDSVDNFFKTVGGAVN